MIHVFCGPTIGFDEVRARLGADVVCLPPVAQGDVYRATLDRPVAIAIIDGYFERVPSVWHKEILWALSRGVHVLGASSMGALRAAELETFGMIGVGRVFEAFRDGVLEDDDEVAVVHGDADSGFRAASEAMVNIRATLHSAAAGGVIDADEHELLLATAKALPYQERSYGELVRAATGGAIARARLGVFAEWVREGRVDRKRDDAVELLDTLGEYTADTPPKQVRWEFQHTELWEHALRAGGREPVGGTNGSLADDPLGVSESLLDELRLAGREAYRDRRDAWLARALALEEAERHAATVSDAALQQTATRTRRRHSLGDRDELLAWAARQGLDEESLTALLRDEAKIESMRGLFSREIDRQMAADLRANGRLAALLERVHDKRDVLGDEGVGSIAPTDDEPELQREALLRWHFDRLGQPLPDNLEHYARELDLPGSDVLLRILRRERRYLATTGTCTESRFRGHPSTTEPEPSGPSSPES